MNRRLTQFLFLIPLVIGSLIALFGLLMTVLQPENFWISLATAGFGSIFVISGWRAFRRMGRYIRHNFEWYRAEHPTAINRRGEVTCSSCHSPRVQMRLLMQGTYTREHSCGNCGTSLFYSGEAGA